MLIDYFKTDLGLQLYKGSIIHPVLSYLKYLYGLVEEGHASFNKLISLVLL